MSMANSTYVPILELHPVDGSVIVEVYKVLAKLLGPDLSVPAGSNLTPTDCPFSLTISVAANQVPTVALLNVAAAASSIDKRRTEERENVANGQNPATNIAVQAAPIAPCEPGHAQAPPGDVTSSTVEAASITDSGGRNVEGISIEAPVARDSGDAPPAPKRRRTDESSSLHDVAASNDAAEAAELMAKNHDPHKPDAEGRLPIELSTSNAVWSLVPTGEDTLPCDRFFKWRRAAEFYAAVRHLLNSGTGIAPETFEGRRAVCCFIANGDERLLGVLLDSAQNIENLLEMKVAYGKAMRTCSGPQLDELEPLHVAAGRGRAAMARLLLRRGAKLNRPTKFRSWTPLHLAAANGHVDACELLIEHGADVWARDWDQQTPLHHAALWGYDVVCRALLETSATGINAKNVLGETALHMAADANRFNVAAVLVAMGASRSLKNREGETPYDIARRKKRDHYFLQVLEVPEPNANGENVSQKLNPTLALLKTVAAASSSDNGAPGSHGIVPSGQAPMAAIAWSTVEAAPIPLGDVRYVEGPLASAYAPAALNRVDAPPPRKRRPKRRRMDECQSLHDAAASNDVATVAEFLAKNQNPYQPGPDGRLPIELSTSKAVWSVFAMRMYTPPKEMFLRAVMDGDSVAVRLLLAADADAATENNNYAVAVHHAIGQGHLGVLQALLDSADNIEKLLELKSNYNTADPRGSPVDELEPLHVAANAGRAAMARLLLQRGAKPEKPTKFRHCKPLHFAAGYGFVDVCKVLLEHGADIWARDLNRNTPLHDAAYYGQVEVCRALLEASVIGIDTKNGFGDTALHMAADGNYFHVAEILVAMDANKSLKNAKNETPLDIARTQSTVCFPSSGSLASGARICITGSTDAQRSQALYTIHSDQSGWVGFGLGSSMANGDVVIGWVNGSGGVSTLPHRTVQYSVSFNAQSAWKREALDGTPPAWAKISFTVSRPVGELAAGTTGSALKAPPASNDYIAAWSADGPRNVNSASSPGLGQHTGTPRTFSADILPTKGGGNGTGVDSGTSGGVVVSEPAGPISPFGPLKDNKYTNLVHGVVMFVAWGVAPFVGIFIARYLKDALGVWWFRLHVFFLFIVTMLLTVAGFFIRFLTKTPPHFKSNHEIIGLVVVIGAIVQCVLGVVSDRLYSPARHSAPSCDQVHWWLGRGLVILGIVNIFLGIDRYNIVTPLEPASNGFYIAFGVWVGLWGAAFVVGQWKWGQVHHVAGDEGKKEAQE
ncbi:hypothetical protein HDU96_000179 [Phlyctochytrium bullatum]|nr:hypothetical protein HDU96_000179 [Phlyctochytrium bullatum]